MHTVYTPILLTNLVTPTLIIRVLYQKRKIQQKNISKKNRGMLAQLLLVVPLHYITWILASIVLTSSVVERPLS